MTHPEALQVLLELNQQLECPVSNRLVQSCFEIQYESRFANDRTVVHDRLRELVFEEVIDDKQR